MFYSLYGSCFIAGKCDGGYSRYLGANGDQRVASLPCINVRYGSGADRRLRVESGQDQSACSFAFVADPHYV